MRHVQLQELEEIRGLHARGTSLPEATVRTMLEGDIGG